MRAPLGHKPDSFSHRAIRCLKLLMLLPESGHLSRLLLEGLFQFSHAMQAVDPTPVPLGESARTEPKRQKVGGRLQDVRMDFVNSDIILRRFFAASGHTRHPESLLRYERVQDHLRTFLEHVAAAQLNSADQELLALERQFGTEFPYVQVMGARQLLHALPDFLAIPHLLPDFHDRLAQISVASRLAQWLCSRKLVEREDSWDDVVLTRTAAERARRSPVI